MSKPRTKHAKANNTSTPVNKSGVREHCSLIGEELLQLNDDLAEFCEITAFMSHSFALALAESETLNKEVIAGARRCSNWLQFRSAELKEVANQVQVRYTTQQGARK